MRVFNVGEEEDVVVASFARVRDDVPREEFGEPEEGEDLGAEPVTETETETEEHETNE